MPVIQTAGQLEALDPSTGPLYTSSRSRAGAALSLYNSIRADYAQILRTQPNVRTVVDFIARNLAQLGVGIFERQTDTDRVKLFDHPFAEAMRRPNLADRHLTTYRLMHRTVWDVCAFDIAFWALLPVDGVNRPMIQPLRPDRLTVEGHLWPTGYLYTTKTGSQLRLQPDQVLYIQASHDLDDPLVGVSPIEGLRRIIAEDEAAGGYREQFWRSGARASGIIERPPDAPDWTTPARDRFKTDWEQLFAGLGPNAGGTPILEDGMTWKEAGNIDARSAQYIEARKLSREEAAAAYHVDPIWVGIAGAGLSFSSVVERHKALYQDTLGPWVVMLEQDLTAQALPAFEPNRERLERLYIKLNIAEKLRGTAQDQADSISKLVGRPILTVNEGRALLERNDLASGDGLTVPLNVTIVESSGDLDELEPNDDAGGVPTLARPKRRGVKAGITQTQHEALQTEHVAAHRQTLGRTLSRQQREVLRALGAVPGGTLDDVWDAARWNAELESDLLGLALDLAAAYAPAVAEALNFDGVDVDAMVPWLAESSRIAAENINATTADQLADALIDDEDVPAAIRNLFTGDAGAARVETSSLTRYTMVSAFVARDTAAQAGRSSKVWVVTSSNSRHPELDGEAVPLGEVFSNGLQYPGDPAGGADQVAGCTCLLAFE